MTTMNPPVPVIPESAPFTAAQRAWLNGFFAGLLSTGAGTVGAACVPVTMNQPAVSTDAAPPGLLAGSASDGAVAGADEPMPWHDPALPMDQRLRLAEGKPLPRVLMAAMAQLDCGACGYDCQTYAEAIARGHEKDLTRCAPGGKETSRKLKDLLSASPLPPATAAPAQVTVRGTDSTRPTRIDRNNPVAARMLRCQPLNKPGSAKDTRLVVFDLKATGLTYRVGDALGVYPENCPDSVNWVLERLEASGAEEVTGPDNTRTTLFEAMLRHVEIGRPTGAVVEVMAAHCDVPAQAQALRAMIADDGPGIPEGLEVIDLMTMCPAARPPVREFAAALRPIRPRLYSISSSLKACPDEAHLTVGVVKYVNPRQRQCKGIASTFLGERLRPGQKARVFVQPAHGFHLPYDNATPVIMVGPGTGIAPFRAFLQERKAVGASGANWLFFGDQRREFDFLYQDEVEAYQRDGWLANLDTAFSRDQPEKVYVQTRMLQRGAEIWDWLARGAHIYVCGDATHMAAGVDAALRRIIAQHGAMSDERAKACLADLAKGHRYQRDVY